MAPFKKILIIQTAFIGDVVLSTCLVEKLHLFFPDAQIDFLLRNGNEGLFDQHPFVKKILIWDKKTSKYANLAKLLLQVRRERYDLVVNPHRFFSTGLLTALSGANVTVCFDKNPLSFLATHRVAHHIDSSGNSRHEIERNLSLIAQFTDNQIVKPKIYPSSQAFEKVAYTKKYITISPASVWFTKQYPKENWLKFMDRVGDGTTIFLLGGASDGALCEWLSERTLHPETTVMAGHLSFLESAALMKNAVMNFVNDSAPLHFTSAVDAPVTAIYCSTVPAFGFGPLSHKSAVLETEEQLDCRPCGLHGRIACPKDHFRCSQIDVDRLLAKLP